MRKLLYVIILGALLLAPVERVEVAKLLPIRAVAMYESNGMTVLELDTGEKGTGNDAIEALENLKQNTPAIVYLKTAKYLFVSDNAKDNVDSIKRHLKNDVELYACDAAGRVEKVAQYLDAHGEITELHSSWTK